MTPLIAPVGGVLLAGRLGERAGAPWYAVLLLGLGVSLLDRFFGNPTWRFSAPKSTTKTKRRKWKRLFQGMCAIVLSLAEALRVTMVEREALHDDVITIKGRLSWCIVLLACIACGSCAFHKPSVVGKWLCVPLNVCALASLPVITLLWCLQEEEASLLAAREGSSSSDGIIWLVMAVDYMIADAGVIAGVICPMVTGLMLLIISQQHEQGRRMQEASSWAFVGLVFPCMCMWQRQKFLSECVSGGMSEMGFLYCLACVGALALCCVVHRPFAECVLALHFGLRWIEPALLRLRRACSACYARYHQAPPPGQHQYQA